MYTRQHSFSLNLNPQLLHRPCKSFQYLQEPDGTRVCLMSNRVWLINGKSGCTTTSAIGQGCSATGSKTDLEHVCLLGLDLMIHKSQEYLQLQTTIESIRTLHFRNGHQWKRCTSTKASASFSAFATALPRFVFAFAPAGICTSAAAISSALGTGKVGAAALTAAARPSPFRV